MTPILKKSGLDYNNLKNYRPVSDTAFLSKLIERSALCIVSNHIQHNNLSQVYQVGPQHGDGLAEGQDRYITSY